MSFKNSEEQNKFPVQSVNLQIIQARVCNLPCLFLALLVSNALKYSNHGGTIELGAKQITNEIIIYVADTGIGIPENRIKEVFYISRNFRRKGTNNECGTGLGLVLCKDIVEKHGGKIWAESKENEGSIFYFSLPVNSLQVY